MKIKEMQEQMKAALQNARAICEDCEKGNRDFTAEERQKVSGFLAEAQELKGKLQKAQGDEKMRQQIDALGEGIEIFERTPGAKGVAAGRKGSVGEQFVSSEGWQSWFKSVAPQGIISDARKGLASPPVEFKNFGLFKGQKTLLTGTASDSAGALIVPDVTDIYEALGRYPLIVKDLISLRQTSSDIVEFVRQLTQVTQAAPVPEANVTTYNGSTGEVSGLKPEGAMTFERVSESVKTLAVWIPATKRALSDAAQLRGLIDQELLADLDEELENQILNGDGTGENFTGVANTANTLVQAFDTDILVTTRKAITNLLTNGKQRPTAWVLHPADWETIELLKDGEGRFRWGGPISNGARSLWGVPVVESFFQTQGTAVLANWRKAVLWDREQGQIVVSDSHADFFIRNMIAILAEMRAAFGIIRPSAFVEVDLTEGS